ncbi:MAG: RsmD family RNA methyltransferase [Methanoregula sp.]|nr:RsmD family RNA methyltransferase [Methanoregula sp.]
MGLKDQVRGIIPDHTLCSLSDHFDVIGDIAVLTLAPSLAVYGHILADAIISRRRNIRTVLIKTSRIDGCSRTASYEVIAGIDTVTTHHEYGFLYRLDIGTVFYNPRLASERKRVTDQVCPGERVLVPCCGVGPFVIPAAARGASVVAVEKNPEACRWLAENVQLNGVHDRVTLVNGDASDPDLLTGFMFDRAVIPTPYGMDTIFDVIVPRVKHAGIIHFYTFKNRKQADAMAVEFEEKGYDVILKRACGNVAPVVNRWVFDLVKQD